MALSDLARGTGAETARREAGKSCLRTRVAAFCEHSRGCLSNQISFGSRAGSRSLRTQGRASEATNGKDRREEKRPRRSAICWQAAGQHISSGEAGERKASPRSEGRPPILGGQALECCPQAQKEPEKSRQGLIVDLETVWPGCLSLVRRQRRSEIQEQLRITRNLHASHS